MAALEAAMQLAKGERQSKQQRGGGKGPNKGQASQSHDSAADAELLRETLRLTLQSQNMIRTAFDSSTIAVLISTEETKAELANLMAQWFEQLPKRTDQQVKNRIFPEHPMKLSRKTLAIQYILKAMSKAIAAGQTEQEEPWATIKVLFEMPPEQWETQMQDCKPKFRQPKDGRKWVWHISLSVVASPEIRENLGTLLRNNPKFQTAGIEILPALSTQTQLEKELWKKLKH